MKYIRKRFDYYPETGWLIWKECDLKPVQWNAKCAGTRSGTINAPKGYRQTCIDNKSYREHRIIWFWMTGEWPEEIDHINGIRDDNRWCNLREATSGENKQNLELEKYCGATWNKANGKWKSQIKINRKSIHIGYFDSPELAHQAYLTAKAKYHTFQPVPRS